MDHKDSVAFVESSQLCKIPYWGRSNVVAFRYKTLEHCHLGLIQCIHLLDIPLTINLFE